MVTVPMIRTDAGGGAGDPMFGRGRAVDVQPSAEVSTISTATQPRARPTGLPLHLSMAPPPKNRRTALADRPVRSVLSPAGRCCASAGAGGKGASVVPPTPLSRPGRPPPARRRPAPRCYDMVTLAPYDLS